MKPLFAPLRSTRWICLSTMLAIVAGNAWASGGAPASAGKSKLDVNGTWTAKVEGSSPQSMVFVFKQDREKLTGTLSTNGGPAVEIQQGRVHRSTINFTVATMMPTMPAAGGSASGTQTPAMQKVTTAYAARVDDDTMLFESTKSDRVRMVVTLNMPASKLVATNHYVDGCLPGDNNCGRAQSTLVPMSESTTVVAPGGGLRLTDNRSPGFSATRQK